MDRHLRNVGGGALLALLITVSSSNAQDLNSSAGYQPLVPVSAFARPAAWLDPARMHFSTTVSVGTGFSGTSSALQVTRMTYQIARPAWLEVSVGNALGGGRAGGNGMFLEGLKLGFRPNANTFFQIQYRDVRSPLQYSRDPFGPQGW